MALFRAPRQNLAGMTIVPLLLKNGGVDKNLCSLNSVIQILNYIPEFQSQLQELGDATDLIKELRKILSHAGSSDAISALELRRLMAQATGTPLNSGAQHDTIELFGYLLDHIPSQLFCFETCHEYSYRINNHSSGCPSCGMYPSDVLTPQKFLKLALPTHCKSPLHLEDLIQMHFSSQLQSEGRQCTNCQSNNQPTSKVPYTEQCKVVLYPEYFLVQILRMNIAEGKTIKNSVPIILSKAENIQVDAQSYDIIGAISHIGTANAGHNRAYVYSAPFWFCCEDARSPFQKVPSDDTVEQNYCIILKKSKSKNPLCHSTIPLLDDYERDPQQGLKRPLSEESIQNNSDYPKNVCLGCRKEFA